MTSAANGHFPTSARAAFPVYLERGMLTVPVPDRSKNPGALNDAWEQLRLGPGDLDLHFPEGVSRNIGALNGEPSGGIIDTDLDAIEAVRAAAILMPKTAMVHGRPGKPRSHLWYRVDVPPDKASAKFKDVDGTCLLELRSTGGQTILPPSRHEDTGETLTWYDFGDPATVALDGLRTAVRSTAAAALIARHWPKKGSRHDLALALAGGLLRGGMSVERAERFIRAVCVAAQTAEVENKVKTISDTREKLDDGENVVGWPRAVEILGTRFGGEVVNRVRKWLGILSNGPKLVKVRKVAPYQSFPVHALPGPLEAYVVQAAAALGCDAAFIALPALAVVASAIGNTRLITLKGGWSEPCVVWSATVADSGTLKTPGYLKATKYLITVQKRLLAEFRIELDKYNDELEKWKAAKKENSDQAGDPPEKPVLNRVICSDVTIEKLAEILEDNERGILLGRDELTAWLGSYTRYKGRGGASDLPHWLEAHRAGSWIIDRKGGDRKHYFISRAGVSVTGTIQPGILAHALTPELLDSGLAARLLTAMPPKQCKHWTEAEVDLDTETAYHDLLDKLLALDFKGGAEDEKEPHALGLSADAKRAWIRFYNEWAAEQAASEGEVAAALSKLEGYAARFALIHHVVAHVALGVHDLRSVGTKSIEAGVTLCRWFAGEARRVLSTITETIEERDTRRLVEFIRARGGSITVKALQRSNSRKYPTAEAAESVLTALVTAGLGTLTRPPIGPKGGQPSKVFTIATDSDDTDDTSPDDPDSGDEGPGPASDDTPSPANGPPESQVESEVSSVSSESVAGVSDEKPLDGHPTVAGEVSSDAPEVSSDPPYVLIREQADLSMVVSSVEQSGLVGLDIETTGLNPRTDRARLLTLATDGIDGTADFIVDLFAVDPSPLWESLASVPIVGHNLLFDLQFLARLGFVPGECRDTMLMSQVVHCGDRAVKSHKLADCCQRELGEEVAKGEQLSDWSGPLTPGQLEYAAKDAEIVRRLHDALALKVKAFGLTQAVDIELAALPAIAWMSGAGVSFHENAWMRLADAAKVDADRLVGELDKAAPVRQGDMFGSGWKWDSPKDVAEALTAAGCPVTGTDDDTLAALDHPLAALLRDHRSAKKMATTYGAKWLKGSYDRGRVYASWRQIGADSGRMACSGPNLQNLPRDARYRQCFTAPAGRLLVKADYSQIELRIAARIADETNMIGAYRRGDDLHTLTARRLAGKEDVTKEDRQLAKAVNFGLLYGMGAKAFRIYARSNFGVTLTESQALQYRSAFFAAYPALKKWHAKTGRTKDTAIETRTLAQRRRQNVSRFTEQLNTPVQGTGADGLKAALGLLWQRRDQCPGTVPVLAVHDEIVVECDAEQAEAVAAWLKQAMVDGMAPLVRDVPIEVETKIGATW